MVDPFNVTDYNRTTEELEEFFLFCVFVAGKNAVQTAEKTHKFYNRVGPISGWVNKYYLITQAKKQKLGKYGVLLGFFDKVIFDKPDLTQITLDELLEYPGVGPKTARFFLLHSRDNVKVAVLDTHILKYLNNHGIFAPKSTPQGKTYLKLEKEFLKLYSQNGNNKSLAAFDLDIWKSYRS